jgi:hypothetical protein
VAVTGAIAQDMLSQAQDLVNRLKSNSAYDIQNSWKMLTIFIGANNLCDVCEDPNKNGPTAFATSIEVFLFENTTNSFPLSFLLNFVFRVELSMTCFTL